MTDIIMQRGACVYWGCENKTQGIYCRDHQPDRCRVCGVEPYGSRGLNYGMCIKHYRYWARHHSPQRARILAEDRRRNKKQNARRTERRKAAREAEISQFPAQEPWNPANEAERRQIGGWISGACLDPYPPLQLIRTGT